MTKETGRKGGKEKLAWHLEHTLYGAVDHCKDWVSFFYKLKEVTYKAREKSRLLCGGWLQVGQNSKQ